MSFRTRYMCATPEKKVMKVNVILHKTIKIRDHKQS